MILMLSAMFGGWDSRGPAAPQSKGGYNVELVGWVDSVGNVSSLAASKDGRVVYAAQWDTPMDSLVIVDISDPANPYIYKKIGHDSLECSSVTVLDTFLYVWWYDYVPGKSIHIQDLYIYGISDPLNPVFLKEIYYESATGKGGMVWLEPYIRDTVLYGFGTLKAINVAEPLNPVLIGGAGAIIFAKSLDFPFPYSFHISSGGTPYTWWEIYDLSDPSNMFLVHRDSVYEVYEWPSGIAAWEYNGKRYVYLHGGTFDYSFDVTDPTHPVQLNWGARENPRIKEGIVHGTRYYASATGPDFVVLDLTDPVYEPIIGWYDNEPPLYGLPWGPFLWVNGYVVTPVGVSPAPPPHYGLAIYHYKYESVPEDSSDTTEHYLEWVRTVYGGPELIFSLSQEAHVSFSLFNISGQKAYERDLGTLSPGPHGVELPGLKPGVYFLRLRVNSELIQKKLIFGQEGGFIEPEKRPQLGPGFLAPPPWEALGHRDEKPDREIHVLPLSFSCREPAEITLYTPGGTEGLSLSPDLTDTIFRKAIYDNVLNQGFYSWVPGCDPVLYTGEEVYAPGYYRVFYLDPPLGVQGYPDRADTIALCGRGADEEKSGYPAPIEDAKSPWAIRVYQSGGIDFYARVILLPDPRYSELSARIRVHLWALRDMVPDEGLEPSLSRDFDLELRKDGEVAGQQ